MNDERPQESPESTETPPAAEASEAIGAEALLQAEIDELRAELAEQHDRLLRAMAELDNLRKRTRREVLDARRFAQADLLRPLLGILDDFERALAHAPAEARAENEDGQARQLAFRQGVELIGQSFRQALLDSGVRRIETVGRAFDPSLHEAVAQQAASVGTPAGTVVAEIQAGYSLDDLVLRVSRVVVAQ